MVQEQHQLAKGLRMINIACMCQQAALCTCAQQSVVNICIRFVCFVATPLTMLLAHLLLLFAGTCEGSQAGAAAV